MSSHDFSVCWCDPRTGETGLVKGEEGMYDWAEAEEVAQHFRAEDDGLAYFVGDRDAKVLFPPTKEALDLIESLYKRGDIGSAEKTVLTYHIARSPLPNTIPVRRDILEYALYYASDAADNILPDPDFQPAAESVRDLLFELVMKG